MGFKHRIFIIGGIWVALYLLVILIIAINLNKLEYSQRKLANDTKVMQGFAEIVTTFVDMETEIRGYLLIGEDILLEPFKIAEEKFEIQSRELEQLLLEETQHLDSLKKIRVLKKEWLEGPIQEIILNRKKLTSALINQDQFLNSFSTSKSMATAKQIRELTNLTISEIKLSLQKSFEVQRSYTSSILFLAIAGLPIGLLMGLGLLMFSMAQIDRKIRNIIGELIKFCDDVFETTQTLIDLGKDLSQNSKSMVSRFGETTTSVRSLSEMTSQNTESAKVAYKFTQESELTAQKGGDDIKELAAAMLAIKSSASKIKEVSQLIDDIAFQTNLLALNAAVEAARAGEHGKGFAVVADAVRSLAQKSTDATKEIHSLILENEAASKTGGNLADKTTDMFQKIVLSVRKVNELVNQVSSGSQKQSVEIVQISVATQEIESDSKLNFEISQKLADYRKNLNTHANGLKMAVLELSGIIQGKI